MTDTKFTTRSLVSAHRASIAAAAGFAVVLSAGMITGCERPGRESAASAKPVARERGPLRVVATLAPVAGIVRELIPPDATLITLTPPGQSEHGYEFTPTELASLNTADLVVYVGLNLEPKLEKFLTANPSSGRVVICMAETLNIRAESDHDHDDHDHAHDDHTGTDPHLWLDPVLVREFIPKVAWAVGEASKRPGVTVSSPPPSTDRLLERVDEVDRRYRERLGPARGRSVVTHHNAWSRLADRYGLEIASVIRPIESAEPTPGQIAKCVDAIRSKGVSTIFVEPQFRGETAQRVAEAAGVRIAVLDPLGRGDWFDLMNTNLESLVSGLSDGTTTATTPAQNETRSGGQRPAPGR